MLNWNIPFQGHSSPLKVCYADLKHPYSTFYSGKRTKATIPSCTLKFTMVPLRGRPYMTSDDFCHYLTPLHPSSDDLIVTLYSGQIWLKPPSPYDLTSYMDNPL